MRILDIGVATAYALLCLGLISVMNPYGPGSAAAQDLSQQRASSAIFQYIASVGLVYLAEASPPQVCLSLHQHSNSTLILGGAIGGVDCTGEPTAYLGLSTLTLSLSGRSDVIEAWEEAA